LNEDFDSHFSSLLYGLPFLKSAKAVEIWSSVVAHVIAKSSHDAAAPLQTCHAQNYVNVAVPSKGLILLGFMTDIFS